MDTRIYVMTHKKIENISNELYIPLQVGKILGEDAGYIGDDTGDNISDKNPSYCELTGMYWIWKNVTCDIVGICHYRRYFMKQGKLVDKVYIENLVNQYPIVIPNSRCVKDKNAYEHYEKRHYAKDLNICREVIAEKYPEYLMAYDFTMQTILVSIGNMWITKKEIYDRYCEWLFDILFEVEKRIDITGYDAYQKRVMGFLAERLFRVWLMMQSEKITEEIVEQIEPQELVALIKREALIHTYVKSKIMPVIEFHKSQDTVETLAQPMNCPDDFCGKFPIWFCTWEEETDMTENAKRRLEYIRRRIPKDKAVVRVITFSNCMKYVTFTQPVIQKFQDGKISLECFTQFLRAELLYRYGGAFLDQNQSALEMMKNIHYVEKQLWINQFLMESLWLYAELEDNLSDINLTDEILTIAREEFGSSRKNHSY